MLNKCSFISLNRVNCITCYQAHCALTLVQQSAILFPRLLSGFGASVLGVRNRLQRTLKQRALYQPYRYTLDYDDSWLPAIRQLLLNVRFRRWGYPRSKCSSHGGYSIHRRHIYARYECKGNVRKERKSGSTSIATRQMLFSVLEVCSKAQVTITRKINLLQIVSYITTNKVGYLLCPVNQFQPR